MDGLHRTLVEIFDDRHCHWKTFVAYANCPVAPQFKDRIEKYYLLDDQQHWSYTLLNLLELIIVLSW